MLAFTKENECKWYVEVDRLRIDVEQTQTGWMITAVLTDLPGEPCVDNTECEYEDGCPDGCLYTQPDELFNRCVWSHGGEPLSQLVKAMRNDLMAKWCKLPLHIRHVVADGWQIR